MEGREVGREGGSEATSGIEFALHSKRIGADNKASGGRSERSCNSERRKMGAEFVYDIRKRKYESLDLGV